MNINPPYHVNKTFTSRLWKTEYNSNYIKKDLHKIKPVIKKLMINHIILIVKISYSQLISSFKKIDLKLNK